ncbi:F0F1 ATP synthase subunit delta [Campylobacter sp. CX2-4080-23]|uniref:F0F1 ATP synthase subunit delta n=1 Tax=Campylobacter porcelli TaxID=1660073 RepID=UPI002EC7D112|nr:F0F1 ATP synthase subunit delta [Campylobacter sp. CX2-4080-23]
MREVVAKKYVKALILTLDANEFDKASVEFRKLASAFSISKFNFIIDSPMIDAKSKSDFLLSLIDDNSNSKLSRFLMLLSQKHRLHLIPEISKEFEYQKAIRDSKFKGLISGNIDITPAQKSELESKFSNKFDVKVEFETIKNDFNGIKIELDDLGVEVSFSIDRLRAQMSEYILKAI